MADSYIDPLTGVLRNRLGITGAGELQRVEADLVGAAEAVLYRERSVQGRYDLDHLQAVHEHLFGRVYDWAGQLRTLDMAKGNHVPCPSPACGSRGPTDVRGAGRQRPSSGLDRRGFSTEAGRLLGDLNALHPFREGNGRTQRAFLQLLARDAGWQLAWGQVAPAVNARRSAPAMADPEALVGTIEEIAMPSASPFFPRA